MVNVSKTIEFKFCKLHFVHNLFPYTIEEFVEHIKDAPNRNFTDLKGHVWHIGGVIETKIEGTRFIYGKLGKESQKMTQAVWDKHKKDFVEKFGNVEDADYCRFVIDVGAYIIAIQEEYFISVKSFIEKLKQFIPKENRNDINFDFLTDKEDVFSKIASWDTFDSAKFVLRPTNPESDKEFEKLDELIRHSGAAKAKMEFKSEKEEEDKQVKKKGKRKREAKKVGVSKKTLAKTGNNIIQMAISMASVGYGNFVLEGRNKDGNVEKIRSTDSKDRLTRKVPKGNPESIIDGIRKVIKSIRKK